MVKDVENLEMVLTNICYCGHSKMYHQDKQIHDKNHKFVSRSYHECLMDGCDCEQFDLKEIKQVSHWGNKVYATD